MATSISEPTLLSADQLRAIAFLRMPCEGGKKYVVPEGEMKGEYCAECVETLVGMFRDSYAWGEMHERSRAHRAAMNAAEAARR